jgi:hypothetical protein
LVLPYILAIRSNHGLWLPQDQQVYEEPWQTFKRTFSNGTTEIRYMRGVIYGKRHRKRYWLLTTDPETLPENSTSFVMVAAPEVKLTEIRDSYGFRAWIEYGLKQAKDALGWADFRVTEYAQIEKWWEIVISAFLMVSLFADAFNDACPMAHRQFAQHPWWNRQRGWKYLLNNLRLIIQPLICSNWLKPWLELFPDISLQPEFEKLIHKMNQFICPVVRAMNGQPLFSSA